MPENIHFSFHPPVTPDTPEERRRGRIRFSLKELILIVLVLGILLGIGVRAYQTVHLRGERDRSRHLLGILRSSTEIYRCSFGEYPRPTHQIVDGPYLQALSQFGPNIVALKDGVVVDTWGNPVHVRLSESGRPIFWSDGPNGMDESGGGDDVTADK